MDFSEMTRAPKDISQIHIRNLYKRKTHWHLRRASPSRSVLDEDLFPISYFKKMDP